MRLDSLQWWKTEAFNDDTPLPEQLKELAPYGVALVSVYGEGATQGGWGLRDSGHGSFMKNFRSKLFSHRTKVHAMKTRGEPFAIVMRSINAICIDIDGKNGGLESVTQLGLLPPTFAEISKSGDGFHLFYSVDEPWDDEFGFNTLDDMIGIVEGVDIRATGCVYHYPQQRWNDRPIAPAPEHLLQRLHARKMHRSAAADRITKITNEGDEMDTAMLHSDLMKNLAKPIQAGSRNNTLFAIGSKMFLAGMEGWETFIADRADEVGLEEDETKRLISNIALYADSV